MLEHAGGTADREIALLKAGSERLMGPHRQHPRRDQFRDRDRRQRRVLDVTVSGSDIHFDLSRSSPPCSGPMNSVWATTQSAVYVAMKHIFPDVPINAG